MSDIITLTIDKLKAASSVTDLVGQRVYVMEAPQDAVVPYITVFEVSRTPENYVTGAPDNVRSRVQVDCWSSTLLSTNGAKTIASAVRAALSEWTTTSTTPDVYSTKENLSQDMREAPSFGKEDPIYRVMMDWSIWYEQ